MEESILPVGVATTGKVVLGSIRKKAEQATMSKSVSSIPLRSLHKFLPPGSCFSSCLKFIHRGLWAVSWNQLFFPTLLLVMVFITSNRKKVRIYLWIRCQEQETSGQDPGHCNSLGFMLLLFPRMQHEKSHCLSSLLNLDSTILNFHSWWNNNLAAPKPKTNSY